MAIEELLRRGGESEAAGDWESAEAAYREADELQDGEAAILLGLILKRKGDVPAAEEAFSRAEARGHCEAANSLGNLLWGCGDLEGAKSAFQRSISAGSDRAALNLGLLLAHEGVVEEALQHLRSAEEKGFPEASWAIGCLLDGRDDLWGAEAAYRRAADAGNADAAFRLGCVLAKFDDVEGARAALRRAHELGDARGAEVLEVMNQAEAQLREAGVKPSEMSVFQAPVPVPPTSDQAPAQPLVEPAGRVVVLTAAGDNKIMVIKVVRAWTRWGLDEAKAFVENVPQAFPLNLMDADAHKLVTDLSDAGATAEMRGEDAAARGESPADLVVRGTEANQRGDWNAAEAAYRRADELGDAEGAFQLGELLIEIRRDPQQALDVIRRADARGHARAATRLGALLADSGDVVGGEEAFGRAHERGDPQATYFLGTIRDRAGDPQSAASYYNEALDRGFSMAGWSLGLILRDLGDAPGSRRAFERGDALGHPECAHHMAVHYHDDGNIEAAIAAARRADEGGSADGSSFLAALSFGIDDKQAEEAARRADERGSALGAHFLALLLQRRGDLPGAQEAESRARRRGYEDG